MRYLHNYIFILIQKTTLQLLLKLFLNKDVHDSLRTKSKNMYTSLTTIYTSLIRF